MLSTLKTAALSALIAVSAIAAIPAAAQAEGIYLNFGGHNRAGIHFGDGEARWEHDSWHGGRERRCSPERAMNKAERMGLHRVRLIDVSRRTITVAGRQYGERIRITFARAPHCPVLY